MREGAACSPCLWAVYADGLLLVLRKSKLGCHVAGQWMGGFLYADDISLQQNLNFDADAATRRSGFIGRSVEVREQFSSASPAHVLKAVRILCCHGYGAVLWRLVSSSASSFFKAYNSCVKRVFRLPLNTFTYLVEGHLNAGAPLLRNMVLSRYPTFYQNLRRSPSVEVSLMAEIVSKDARTTTAGNLAYLASLTSLDCATSSKLEVKSLLPVEMVPENETWRLGLLDTLLQERCYIEREGGDIKRVTAMISSLCTT